MEVPAGFTADLAGGSMAMSKGSQVSTAVPAEAVAGWAPNGRVTGELGLVGVFSAATACAVVNVVGTVSACTGFTV